MIDMCERNDVELYIVLLNMSYYKNIMRLKKRHLNSGKTVDSISDKAIQSVIGKINQFRGAYDKAMQINSVCKHQMTLDVANMKVDEEVVSVLQFMSLI